MERLGEKAEHKEDIATPESNPEFLRAKEYGSKLEARSDSLAIMSEGIEDVSLRKSIQSRLSRVTQLGRQAVAGSMFMLAANGAFGQEMNTADTERLNNAPVAEASAEKMDDAELDTEPDISEEDKKIVLASALQVAGETIKNEAEKIISDTDTKELQKMDVDTSGIISLPFGAGDVNLKDPETLAYLASKLGGNVGTAGKLAMYAQDSYKKLNEKPAGAEKSEGMSARTAMDLISAFPLAGKIGQIAKLAGKAMDAKDKVDKGEKITAGEVLETVLSFVPHAAVLMTGINLLKKLPQGEVVPVTQEDLYKN